jgi:hypothetical protein
MATRVSSISHTPNVTALWCGSTLLGILREEQDGPVLRLESHARALTVSVVALEQALAEARERIGGNVEGAHAL